MFCSKVARLGQRGFLTAVWEEALRPVVLVLLRTFLAGFASNYPHLRKQRAWEVTS